MTKILTHDELMEVSLDMPGAEDARDEVLDRYEALRASLTVLAAAVAGRLGVRSDEATFDDGELMVGFSPANDGDPVPPELDGYDPDGDWGDNEEEDHDD